MKFLKDFFSLSLKEFTNLGKSLPKNWLGHWVDINGKTILIEESFGEYAVSVFDKNGNPYTIDLLGDDTKSTIKLKAIIEEDTDGKPMLQVEAGTEEIGPTYQLYFITKKESNYRIAKPADPIDKILIKPNVGMGLYDDWEDDLGVPWAFPLEPFQKKDK
jgi:hypothetical protein